MVATEQKNAKDILAGDLVTLLGLNSGGKLANVPLWFDIAAPAATGAAAIDFAALQSAIDRTPAYGTLFIQRGAYKINAELVISKSMTIVGEGVYEFFQSSQLPDIPLTSPYINGTTINQVTAGIDIIQITGARVSVNLESFGLKFDAAIQFTNTGHGIHTIPALLSGGPFQDTSIVKCKWRNLVVFGTDGNHYGYRLVNYMHCVFEQLRAFGGGVIHALANSQTVNYGNSIFISPMGTLTAAGTADAYRQESTSAGSFGILNFNQWIRPQANAQSFPAITIATVAQALWRDVGGAYIRNNLVISPDLEPNTGVAHPAVFGAQTYVNKGGGFLPPAGAAYVSEPPYNPNVYPTVTVGASAGTGGAAQFLNNSSRGSDLAGIVKIDVGTSPSTNDLATVTFANPLPKVPNFIQVGLVFVTAGTVCPTFYATNITATGFAIRSNQAPPPSVSYQLYYRVVY